MSDYESSEFDDDFLKIDAAVSAIRSNDLTESAFYSVQRQPGTGKQKMEFVERVPFELYDWGGLLMYLAEEYGGGNYRIQLHAGGVCRANTLVPIAERKNTKRIKDIEPGGGAIGQIAQMIDQNTKAMMAMVEGLTKQLGGASFDREKQLNEIKYIKELFVDGGDKGKKSSPADFINDLVLTLGALEKIGLNFRMGGGDDKDGDGVGGWASIAEKLLPLAGDFFASRGNQAPVATVEKIPVREAGTMQQQTQEKNEFSELPKLFINKILKAAYENKDQSLWAEIIIETVPIELIRQKILDQELISRFINSSEAVKKVEPWILGMVEHIKHMLGLPSKFGENSTQPGGDSGDDIEQEPQETETNSEN